MPTDEPTLTRSAAVGAALESSAFTIRQAWAWSPAWLSGLMLANVVLALTPAAQVIAVGWLVGSAGGSAADFIGPLVLLTAMVGVSQVIDQATDLTGQRLRNRLRRRYQDELMQTVASLEPQRIAESETNALIQACRGGLFDISRLTESAIAAAGALVTAVALCATVWRISPLAGILVVAALLPSIFVYAWEARMQDVAFVPYGEQERRSDYSVEQLVGQRTATELITLGSGRTVAAIADGGRERADALVDRILQLLIRADTIGGIGTAVLLGAALAGIMLNGAGGAGVAAGIIGVLASMTATRAAGFSYGDLMSIAPKVRAYRRFVDSVPPTAEQSIAADAGELVVDRLTVTYPRADRPAVDDVSLRASRGQVIALVGINGAGKTTTINAIMGVVERESGAITVDGVEVDTMELPRRLGHFGLLSQEFGRYEFTIRDAVRLGRPDGTATDVEIWRALEAAHASDMVRRMAEGLDSQLGSQFGGVGLSGGQWQRLALARIYLRDAPIWILDEPTSAIDAEAEEQIFAELQRTKADRITIVVSHRAWTLKNMDRIYVFDEGRIIEQGSYEQLLGENGRFAQIFAEQIA